MQVKSNRKLRNIYYTDLMKKIHKIIIFVVVLVTLFFASFVFYLYKTDKELNWNSWRFLTDSHYDRQNMFGEPVYVYETEVDDGEACTAIEQYDPERKVCAYQCNDAQDCDKKQKLIDDELNSWTEDVRQGKPITEKTINNDNTTLKVEYKVSPNGSIKLLRGSDSPDYQQLWRDLDALVPKYILDKYLVKFQIYDDRNDETIAFTETEDDDLHWRFGINYSIYQLDDTKEKKITLIHELAHIITLNDTQFEEDENCKTYKSDDGCTLPDSYLNNYVELFWDVKEEPGDSSDKFEEDKFVDPYAATGPEEDIAETFAYFVLQSDPDGTEIKNQKIKFFYNFPELVKVRSDMRTQLARSILN